MTFSWNYSGAGGNPALVRRIGAFVPACMYVRTFYEENRGTFFFLPVDSIYSPFVVIDAFDINTCLGVSDLLCEPKSVFNTTLDC